MVTEGTLSKPSCSGSDVEEESIGGSSENEEHFDGTVALRDDDDQQLPSFGNISVMNSSDVHFGNKTFYQGPVTIKQFLYANGNASQENGDNELILDAKTVRNGVDNPVFIPDLPAAKPETQVESNRSGPVKGFRRLQKFSQENVVFLVSLLAILMVSLVVLMLVLLLKHGNVSNGSISYLSQDRDEQVKNTPVDAPLDPEANLTLPGKLKLVSRLEWLAQPPVEPANKLPVPVPYVIIHHTATENCSSQAQCRFHVRYIQMFHIESRNWWDIGYNFLVGGDGEAYEGRGWTSEGAHMYGYNAKSIGIGFIGTFNNFVPPQRQITACKLLIAQGVKQGYIKKDYKLLAARQLQTTQSPGDALYKEMKTWDHWAPGP